MCGITFNGDKLRASTYLEQALRVIFVRDIQVCTCKLRHRACHEAWCHTQAKKQAHLRRACAALLLCICTFPVQLINSR